MVIKNERIAPSHLRYESCHSMSKVFATDNNSSERVPDLPGCISSGKDLPDAISQITDAASNWLCVAEDEELTISDPTPQAMIIRDSEDVISLIQIDTTAYRAATENRIVRRNIPCLDGKPRR